MDREGILVQRTLALILVSILLLQCAPLSSTIGEGTHEVTNKPIPMDDRSDLSPTGEKLNTLWLQGPRKTGVPLSYDDVMLVINDASQLSKDIGNYFLARRPIPQNNICNFTTSTSEHINRNTFDTQVRPQVEACLKKNGLKDKINVIVTTKGIPLGVQDSGSRYASVDSELSLILGPHNLSIGNDGWEDNPYFGENGPFSHAKYGTYLVTRLTGYTLADATRLVDLADNSTGKRGLFLIDEGAKGNGYAIGDTWMRNANTTLVNKGYNVSHDKSGTFQMFKKDLSGYVSWGSNDGNYWSDNITNSWMETDTTPSDNLPDGWLFQSDGATWLRVSNNTFNKKYGGGNVTRIVRSSVTAGSTLLYQDIPVSLGVRYWLDGRFNLTSVSNDGGARMFVQAYDKSNNLVGTINGNTYIGNQNWPWLPQVHYEPFPGATKLRVGVEFYKSTGTVMVDNMTFHMIKPNNTYVPGAVGETYVSTGGRSFMYPTDYGQSLVADLVREGISGVSGHVYEPYLEACGHPDILFDRYTSAYTMAESFWMSLALVGWQEVVVGDPKMVPYWDMPDPMVDKTNITVAPSDPAVGENTTISARIYGRGADITNVEVEFYNGIPSPANKLGPTLLIPTLARGQGKWVTLKHTFTDTISYTITVVVDPANKIREATEDNNVGSINIHAFDRPDLQVTPPDIKFASSEVVQGTKLAATVTASNIGGVSTNLTGTANLTLSNGTVMTTYPLHLDNMTPSINVEVLNASINTTAIVGTACINVTLISSRVEANTANNKAGACFFVKHFEFSLEQLTYQLVVPPLTTGAHLFNITNKANLADTFTVTYTVSNGLWNVDVTPVTLALQPGATARVQVSTFSTGSLSYGDRLEVNVTVSSALSGKSKILTFVSITGPTFAVSLLMAETEFNALPGSDLALEMSIGNLGNAQDNVTLTCKIPTGWAVKFDQVKTTLAVNQLAPRIATVTVAKGAAVGTVGELTFMAWSEKGTSNVSQTVYITVNQVYNLSVALTPAGPVDLIAGSGLDVGVKVTNLGNGYDKIKLEVVAQSGLSGTISETDLSLNHAQNRSDITLKVSTSRAITPGTYTVSVKATSESTLVAQADLVIKVKKPDLGVAFIQKPTGSVKEGETVTFVVEVTNHGSVLVSGSNVSLTVGSVQLGIKAVKALGPSEKQDFTYEWKATAGTLPVTATVDPEDALPELDEANNRATFQQKVEAKSTGFGGNGSSIPIWSIIVVIVLVAVAYLGARTFIWSRRLKSAAREGEAKRKAKGEGESKEYTKLDEKPAAPKEVKPKVPPKEERPKEEPPKKEEPKKAPKEKAPPKEEPPKKEEPTELPEETIMPAEEPRPVEPAKPEAPGPKEPSAPKKEKDELDDILELLNKE